MAPHPRQQPRVVDNAALRVRQPKPLTQPQRNQARADHVLHRLTKPKISAQREQRNQLRQTNPLSSHRRHLEESLWPEDRPHNAQRRAAIRAARPRASRRRQCAAGLSTSNRADALSAGSCFRRAGCISPPAPVDPALPLRPSARDNAEGAEPRRSAIGHRVRPTRSDVGAVLGGRSSQRLVLRGLRGRGRHPRGRDSVAGAVSLADRAYRVFPPSPAEARAGPKAGLSGTRGWLPWHQRSSVILAAVAALRSMETRAASQLASAPHRRLSCWSDLASQGMTRPPAATMYLRSNLFAPPAVRAARPPIELTGF